MTILGVVSGGREPRKLDQEALDDAALGALRSRLREVGYTVDALARAERIAPGAFDALRLPLVRHRLEQEDSPASWLLQAFAYDATFTDGTLERALGGGLVEALHRAGLVRITQLDDGRRLVCPEARLLPFEDDYLFCDAPGSRPDSVMGPGPTTQMLLRALPERMPERVLDVGTGAGTIALVAAARGARRVVATDVNARAVAMARLNARLNGRAIECVEGDLLAPVHGERFDLVVSQPPFVTQPLGGVTVAYLHGGAAGDEIALRLFSEVPGALAPGGRAMAFVESLRRPGPPLTARVRTALGAAPLDLLLLLEPGQPLDRQAIAYAAGEHPRLDLAFSEAVVGYARAFEAVGAQDAQRALVVVSDGGGTEPRYTAGVPVPSSARFSAEAVERALGALALASSPDPAMLAAAVALTPAARICEEHRAGGEPRAYLRFDAGALAQDRELNPALAALCQLALEPTSVVDLIAEYAAACDAGPDDVRTQVLGALREGLASGAFVTA